jgi:hypothetical protein
MGIMSADLGEGSRLITFVIGVGLLISAFVAMIRAGTASDLLLYTGTIAGALLIGWILLNVLWSTPSGRLTLVMIVAIAVVFRRRSS